MMRRHTLEELPKQVNSREALSAMILLPVSVMLRIDS